MTFAGTVDGTSGGSQLDIRSFPQQKAVAKDGCQSNR
jgi:hypothetical protein